ncbi:MAG: hypothetical protein GY775_02230 [Candidatus Scalindua sp.]|nr:hypothetical protein [Candidatus Scalindua sp.]
MKIKMRLIGIIIVGIISFCINAIADDNSSSRYSDEPTTIRTDRVPERPVPALELFQGFQRAGPLGYEAMMPTGMVISPFFALYGTYRSGIQMIDENGSEHTAIEWAHRMDALANLTLSGTERILIGTSNRWNRTFQPEDETDNQADIDITTAFFEFDLTEVLAKLDWEGTKPLDYGFTVGRQRIFIDDGFLIDDTMDSIVVTRNTIHIPGTSYARVAALYAWNGIDRATAKKDHVEGDLYGLFATIDRHHSTIDLGMTYLNSPTKSGGDQYNVSLASQQPILLFNTSFDTTFRISKSGGIDGETAESGNGTLFYTGISWAPKGTDNIAYFNAFGAFGKYTPTSREIAGPLGRAGLLFSGNGLSKTFGAPISNRTEETHGAALGYQMFFDGHRRNVVLEIGAREERTTGGIDKIGMAVNVAQSIRQRMFIEVGGFGIKPEDSRHNTFGFRTTFAFTF